jgi:cobalt-zinc-cadmium efflux system outer membrane protein
LTRRIALLLTLLGGTPLSAQRLVTRREAIEMALTASPRVALARADSAAAHARGITARARPNPSVSPSYSKATPQGHVIFDLPIESPRLRGARIGAARASIRAARLQFLSERTAAVVEVDTTYTQALAALARFRLARLTATESDSLHRLTIAQRDAGDASDLDVDLASITAGQQRNTTSADSLAYMSAMLTLQTLMGLSPDTVLLALADSLRITPSDTAETLLSGGDALTATPVAIGIPSALDAAVPPASPTLPGLTPSVAAAEANVRAAELSVLRERRNVFQWPALSFGVEFHDPTGSETGLLPVLGLALPLPLFNRNQGPIAEAEAERERARAQLASVRLEVRQRLAEGLRERAALRAEIKRDIELVVRAQRVATRSLTGYREGASALPAVLEARRTAREVLAQYIDDVAALLTVNTELRALTQTVSPAP